MAIKNLIKEKIKSLYWLRILICLKFVENCLASNYLRAIFANKQAGWQVNLSFQIDNDHP